MERIYSVNVQNAGWLVSLWEYFPNPKSPSRLEVKTPKLFVPEGKLRISSNTGALYITAIIQSGTTLRRWRLNTEPVELDRMRFIDQEQHDLLTSFIRKCVGICSLDDMVNACKLSAQQAIAVLLSLYEADRIDLFWIGYHFCSPHQHASIRKFVDGFQHLPCYCANCGVEVSNQNEFLYDIGFSVKSHESFDNIVGHS